VYAVPADPGDGLPATSAPPARTWTLNSAGAAVPPWSLTTLVATVSVPAAAAFWSS
jgi:hypothetical protein